MKRRSLKSIDPIVMDNLKRNNQLFNDPGIVINGFQFRSLKSSPIIERNSNIKQSLSHIHSKNDNLKIYPPNSIPRNNYSFVKEQRIKDKLQVQKSKSILHSLIERKILNEKYSLRNLFKSGNEIHSGLKSINRFQKTYLIRENDSLNFLKPRFYIKAVRLDSNFKRTTDFNKLNNLRQFDFKLIKEDSESFFRIMQKYKSIEAKKLAVKDIKIPFFNDIQVEKRKSELIEKKVDYAKAHRNSKNDFIKKIKNFSDHNIQVFSNREIKKIKKAIF